MYTKSFEAENLFYFIYMYMFSRRLCVSFQLCLYFTITVKYTQQPFSFRLIHNLTAVMGRDF